MFCNLASLRAHSGIESRLPAAGLPRRDADLHPEALQDVYDGLAGARVEGVEDTGDEELGSVSHEIIINVNC